MTAVERSARAAALQNRTAGIVSRVLAAGVDVATVAVLTIATFVGFALLRYMITSGRFELPGAGPLRSAISLPLVAVVYLFAAWALQGQTLGGVLMGLRVVRRDGQPLGPARSLVRAVVCVAIGGPSLLWTAVSTRNAAVHDLVCGSAVLYDWKRAASPQVTALV